MIILFLYDDILQKFKSPQLLRLLSVLRPEGGGSVVVDSLLIVTPIVGFCNCSMFCCPF